MYPIATACGNPSLSIVHNIIVRPLSARNAWHSSCVILIWFCRFIVCPFLVHFSKQRFRKVRERTRHVVEIHCFLGVEPKVWGGIQRRSKLESKCGSDMRFLVDNPINHFEITPQMLSDFFWAIPR